MVECIREHVKPSMIIKVPSSPQRTSIETNRIMAQLLLRSLHSFVAPNIAKNNPVGIKKPKKKRLSSYGVFVRYRLRYRQVEVI